MRLIRIVSNVVDDGAELGIIKNDFSSEILVEPNSSLSLLNCSMNVSNASLTVDGANNDIEFQFTNDTGVRTASLSAGTYIANAHDAFFRINLIRTLNNSLGRLKNHDNTPVGGDDSTGGGFGEDIGKQWEYEKTGGVYSARWMNATRNTTKADWNIDTTLTATPAATTTYNASTFTNTDTNAPSSFWSVTPYNKGCGQFYMRIKGWQATSDDNNPPSTPNSGVVIGMMLLDPGLPGNINYNKIEYGISVQQLTIEGYTDIAPMAYLIENGAISNYDEEGDLSTEPVPVYWLSDGNSSNATICINRNFGHLQYIQYADTYFKYILDGAIPVWDYAMVGYKFEAGTTLALSETGQAFYEILNDDGSASAYECDVSWNLDFTSGTFKEGGIEIIDILTGAQFGSGTIALTDIGGGVMRWRTTITLDAGGTATWTSPEAVFDTTTQDARATAGTWLWGEASPAAAVAYGETSIWASPNEADFPLSHAEAVELHATVSALSPNPYSATYPGIAADDINNTEVGNTTEVVMYPDTNVKTIATLYPVISLLSPDTEPTEPTPEGYVSVDNVRGTLNPFITPTKHFSIHEDHHSLSIIAPPSVPTNRTTTKNFLQLSNQVADYIGFYNRAQRSGTFRSPASGFNTFRPNQSIKTADPNTGPNTLWQYTASRTVVSSELFQNYQLIWNSKPLAGFDGATSAPKSLLATIPVQLTTAGGFQYEARNVNRISFRNAESFSLRNAEIQILSADGNPVAFNGLQTFTLALTP